MTPAASAGPPGPGAGGPTGRSPGSQSAMTAASRRAARQWAALREERLFLFLAILIGVLAGLAVVCFRVVIGWFQLYLLGSPLTPLAHRLPWVPALVGLAIGAMLMHWFAAARGSGVNQTKAAVYIFDGHIPFRTVVGKFITSSLAIGSGQSLGPEDPSIQIGAGLASLVARKLNLSRARMRLIAPLGAAAGLAAAFNAPIAAILFIIEEIVGQWSVGILSAVVLAAVSGTVVARWFLGAHSLFTVPTFELRNPLELAAYAALGVVGGFASLLFVKSVLWLRPRLKALPRWTQYLQPAAAGLLVGVIALWYPQVLGAGYIVIDQALHAQFLWTTLAVLALLKILATMVSFTSGTPGGMFAPTLVIGALVGGAVGGFEHLLFPHITAGVSAYVLVGMGVAFAGILRAPMTSVFMIIEVSGSYTVILPLLIANSIAFFVSRNFQRQPIFEMLTHQDGMDLPSMEERREEEVLHVEDAMQPSSAPVMQWSDRVEAALTAAGDHAFLLVYGGGARWSGIATARLASLVAQGLGQHRLGEILAGSRLPVLHLDEPLEMFLREAGDAPILPVVHRADNRLLGTVSLAGVLATYRHADQPAPEASPSAGTAAP